MNWIDRKENQPPVGVRLIVWLDASAFPIVATLTGDSPLLRDELQFRYWMLAPDSPYGP